MASKDARKRKLEEIREIAEGWGKIVAQESFSEGPGLDVTLASDCWRGQVDNVIAQLHAWQSQLGPPPEEEPEIPANDPRKVVQATARYLTNNRHRMDYPRYRRSGLPVTSSLAESLVKQVSKRMKGTEKFWNDGPSGEAILQLRAAVISDGDQLQKWIRNRPVSPFSPRCRCVPHASST